MTTAEPRVPPLPRAEWTDEARDVFAFWGEPDARENGSNSNTMMTLAQHPRMALALLELGRYFMVESTLAGRLQKIVVLRVAHRNGSFYQWAHNAISGRQLGLSDEEIEGLKIGPDAPVWNDHDRIVLRAIDQTCEGGKIDDGTWAELGTIMDRRQAVDLIHAVGYFSMVAWGLVAMRVQLEPGL